jgi:hypothetical protein
MLAGLALPHFTVQYCTFIILNWKTCISSDWFTTHEHCRPFLACSKPQLSSTASPCLTTEISYKLCFLNSPVQTWEMRHTVFLQVVRRGGGVESSNCVHMLACDPALPLPLSSAILSRDGVTVDGVWIGDQFYWALTQLITAARTITDPLVYTL